MSQAKDTALRAAQDEAVALALRGMIEEVHRFDGDYGCVILSVDKSHRYWVARLFTIGGKWHTSFDASSVPLKKAVEMLVRGVELTR